MTTGRWAAGAVADGTDGPYPTGADYSEAIRDTTLCFAHPTVAGGLVAMGPLRMPRAVSGNFGSVFRVTSTGADTPGTAGAGREFAVKCFTRAIPGRLRRYRAVAEALRVPDADWRVPVEYVPRGILVRGRWFPVILMEWVEGTGLIPWIEAHLGDRAGLEGLAERFAAVVADLEAHGLAHGDLQHGNLIVAPDGGLRLIDYDGMYVPSLAGLPAAEHGHRNYQHPLRGSRDFGPGLDRFSAHLIHLTLRTLAREPWLWRTFHEDGGEHLLLKAEDFNAPTQSDRFSATACASPALTDEWARLAHWATRPMAETGPLGEPVTSAARPRGGLPGWLAEALVQDAGEAAALGTLRQGATEPPNIPPDEGASGIPEREPEGAPGGAVPPAAEAGRAPAEAPSTPPPVFTTVPRRLTRHIRAAASALAAFAAVTGTGVVLAGPWIWAAVAAAVTGATVVVSGYGSARRAYRDSPELRRRDAAVEAVGDAEELDALAALRVRRARAATEDARGAHADVAARQLADGKLLRSRYEFEREAVEKRLAEALESVEQRRVLLEGSGGREELLALRALQERAIDEGLRRHPIPAEMLGSRIAAVLRGEGVRTAADFTRITSAVPTSAERRDQAVLSRPGRTVKIDGMSPALARSLQEWRDEVVEELRIRLPATLPYQEAQELHRRRADRRLDLARQAARARAVALDELALLDADLAAEENRLAGAGAGDVARAEAAVRDAEAVLAAAESAREAAATALDAARAEAESFTALTFPRFVAHALRGR
ncbi:hypothetical protein [Yinghuangia sp. YIM S09857]|uniref:hypothetical protein n=1 Tax=Yinghuangia sp. YIM S09857 TaxID=3436929 RepID=UPI003F530A09